MMTASKWLVASTSTVCRLAATCRRRSSHVVGAEEIQQRHIEPLQNGERVEAESSIEVAQRFQFLPACDWLNRRYASIPSQRFLKPTGARRR